MNKLTKDELLKLSEPGNHYPYSPANKPVRYRSNDEIDGEKEYHGMLPPRSLPNDMVVLPKHYSRFQIEPLHFLAANKANPFQYNIVKYTMRCEHKHPEPYEDLCKAVRCAIIYGKFVSGDPDWWKPYANPALAAAIEEEMFLGYQRETQAGNHQRRGPTQGDAVADVHRGAGSIPGEPIPGALPPTGRGP